MKKLLRKLLLIVLSLKTTKRFIAISFNLFHFHFHTAFLAHFRCYLVIRLLHLENVTSDVYLFSTLKFYIRNIIIRIYDINGRILNIKSSYFKFVIKLNFGGLYIWASNPAAKIRLPILIHRHNMADEDGLLIMNKGFALQEAFRLIENLINR